MLIKDLDRNEKPRERILKHGVSVLSDAELLAIILRTGGRGISAITLARKLLKEFRGVKGLMEAELEQICACKSVGLAKAASIKAVYEISLRFNVGFSSERMVIKTPADVFKLIRKDLFSKKREHLYLISLDSRSGLISKDLISIGTVTETIVHPREIFMMALAKNAVSVILAHNHPSQDPEPSSEDVLLTERVASAGGVLGIPLLDHVVVCNDEYLSVKALGLFTTKDFSKKGGE